MVQLQLLNKILDDKDSSIILYNNLNEDFFSDYPNEFGYITRHLNKYGSIPDKETFLNTFPDFQLLKVTESSQYLLDELYRDYNTRYLAKTFNKVRDFLNEGKVEDAMRIYTQAAQDTSRTNHLNCVDILSDTTRYDDFIAKSQDFSKFYIRTGFKELDDLIGGWDTSEELVTIAARPGVGKSQCLIKMALAAVEQGLTVGFYSGEMSVRKIGYRFDTMCAHISNTSLIRGDINVDASYHDYILTLKNKYKGCLKVITPDMINGPAGVQALRAFIEKEHINILFVDQHSLLEDDRKGRNPVEKASNISRDLKNLQVMKHIPIIAASQQNRSEFNDSPGTANIAQSDRISQDSTIVLFLEQKNGILTLHLAKSRDSANDKHLKYVCDWDKGIFQFLPQEADNKVDCDKLRDEYEFDESEGTVF